MPTKRIHDPDREQVLDQSLVDTSELRACLRDILAAFEHLDQSGVDVGPRMKARLRRGVRAVRRKAGP